MFSELLFGNENIETHHLLIELVLGGLIVIVTGSKLTRNADEISDALNLGKAWIGLLLLATVTSLPELVTGLTAVTLETPNANLAFGNILGSNSFNVAIIVVLNTVLRKGSVLREARPATTLAASFGVVMTGMLLLAFAIENKFANEANFVAGFETVYCVLIFATYIFVMRLLYRFEKRSAEPAPEDESAKPKSMGRLYTGTAITAVLIVAAGYWMTRTGDKLADHPIGLLGGATLGGTFVGAFFLAIATSLPEIVTGIAAVRMGQLDLALGNVFGSNMFNVFVVPFLKLASAVGGKGLIMGGGSDGNAFDFARNTMTGALAILLMGIAIASVTYQSQRRIYFFGFDSVLIGLVYFGGMFMLIMAGS